jgi:hypothetical protein
MTEVHISSGVVFFLNIAPKLAVLWIQHPILWVLGIVMDGLETN